VNNQTLGSYHHTLQYTVMQSRIRQKQFGGEQNLLEYFFTHPNKKDLVDKYHMQIA